MEHCAVHLVFSGVGAAEGRGAGRVEMPGVLPKVNANQYALWLTRMHPASTTTAMEADFAVSADLGESMYDGPGPFDVATCMFALHYFFESESRLRMFLRTVAANLKPGG